MDGWMDLLSMYLMSLITHYQHFINTTHPVNKTIPLSKEPTYLSLSVSYQPTTLPTHSINNLPYHPTLFSTYQVESMADMIDRRMLTNEGSDEVEILNTEITRVKLNMGRFGNIMAEILFAWEKLRDKSRRVLLSYHMVSRKLTVAETLKHRKYPPPAGNPPRLISFILTDHSPFLL